MVPDDIKPTVRRSRNKTERRLVAVLGLDILGYSALMGRGEEQVHRRVGAELERVCREAERSHGRVFAFAGDSVMAEFPSAVEALRCAMRIQESAARRNARLPPDDTILFRLGLNTGEVVVQSDRIGGTTVNVAARLEALAEPGGINLSAAVFEQVQRVIAAPYVAIGPKRLKNIRDPVSVYAIAASVFARDDAVLLPSDVPTRGNRTRGFAPPAVFSLPDKPSIAVLPFSNMSTEPEQDSLADGIAEDVITALSRYPSLFVIARNSCFSYKGRAVEVREIGRELGVRYILGGGLRKSGSRIRITAQLVQAETGNHIWAERYDRDLADIFTVQDEISEAVTIAVAPAIDAAELQRAIRKPPGNLDAWVAYQRGLWHLSKFTSSDISLAEEFFRQAIDLDVTFAGGYVGLASAQLHGAVAFHTRGLSEAIISIEALARRAVELDGADAEARACLGCVLLHGGDHQGARAMIELAVTMSPNLSTAHGMLGHTLIFSGSPGEGIASVQTSIRLDPRHSASAFRLQQLVLGHYFSGEYEASVEAAKQAIRSYPDLRVPHRWLAAAFGQLGRIEEARTALGKAIAMSLAPFSTYVRAPPPWMRSEDHAHLLEGLRKAGWKS